MGVKISCGIQMGVATQVANILSEDKKITKVNLGSVDNLGTDLSTLCHDNNCDWLMLSGVQAEAVKEAVQAAEMSQYGESKIRVIV